MNQVVFAVNNKYIPLLSVAIRSLLNKNKHNLIINIIYSKLSKWNIDYLSKLCQSGGSKVNFFQIDSSDFEGLPERGHLKVEAYYRMAIPNVIDARKVLYLDCDILVAADITSLFELNISDYPLAAVVDPVFQPISELRMKNGAKYFNSGVMLLNLDYWRKSNLAQKTLDYLRTNSERITYADQCALNAIVDGNFLELDEKFNFQTGHLAGVNNRLETMNDFPIIVHFTGSIKPSHYLCDHPCKHLFLMELAHTPYYYYKIKFLNLARFMISNLNLYPLVNSLRKHLKF